MKKQSYIALFALTATCALPPAVFAQEPPALVVSNEIMDLLEEWSDPSGSLVTLALDSRPELIEGYADFAEAHHDGQPLADIFAERLPIVWAEIAATLGSGDPDAAAPTAAQILAYAMASGGQEFIAWQQELAQSGADFEHFVAESYPDAMAEAAALAVSPARQGIGLIEFAEAKGTGAGEEFAELVGRLQHLTPTAMKDCGCWTAVAFEDQEGPGWVTVTNARSTSEDDQPWPLPTKKTEHEYSLRSRGAAREIDFHRRSEHTVNDELDDESGHSSGMRIRMGCTLYGSALPICPQANACQGQLVTRLGYASRVYEKVEVGGTWDKNSQALAADFTDFTYLAPALPQVTLFAKGIAVGGNKDRSSNLSDQATQFFDGRAAFEVAHDESSYTLGQELLNPAAGGKAGLIVKDREQGSYEHAMRAVWENPSQPIALLPDQTHLFRINTSSRVYGQGYGGHSDSWAKIDSAAFLVSVVRNFSCHPIADGPPARAFWNYGRGPDAPYSPADLQERIQSFAGPLLGATVPNIGSAVPNHFP